MGPLVLNTRPKTDSADLEASLQTRGYRVLSAPMLEIEFPAQILDAIAAHHIDAVLFFSPRTAETFVKLVKSYKLEGELTDTCAICLSPAVQLRTADLTWQRTHVASKPTQEYLLSILDQSFSSV